jgi:Concanavalin A-like lectin/glucanases superfamily
VVALLLLALLLWTAPVAAQVQPALLPFHPSDIVWTHPDLRGLVAWWRGVPGLWGGSRLYDLVPGSTRHGTLTNMSGTSTSGWSASDQPGGYAQLNFDGTDDFVRVEHDPRLDFLRTDSFTLMFWVNTTTSSTRADVLEKTAQTGNFQGYLVFLDQGQVEFYFVDAGGVQLHFIGDTGFTVNGGTWRHVAITYGGTSDLSGVFLYRDGQPATYGTLSAGPLTGSTAGGDFLAMSVTSFPYAGAMADVRIYNRALSATEILNIYRRAQTGNPELFQGSHNIAFYAGALAPSIPPIIAIPRRIVIE